MVQELDNIPGMEAAAAKLAELEAGDAGEAAAVTTQEQRDGVGDRAPTDEGADRQPNSDGQTDTRAAAEAAAAANTEQTKDSTTTDGAKPATTSPPKDEKGRFQKAIERGFTNWKEFNEWKAAETAKVEASRKEIEAKAAEVERKAREVEEAQPQYQPEDYEQAAASSLTKAEQLSLQADGLEKRAEQVEIDQPSKARELLEQAKQLRKQAAAAEVQADNLKEYAANLRKNPPANAQAREAKRQEAVRNWSVAAAREYPELLNLESAVYKAADRLMADLKQKQPELAAHPSSVYYVAKMAKLTTEAARVPGLDKELGQLRARVQELEALSTSGGSGAVQRQDSREAGFADRSDEEQLATLRAQAQGMGSALLR